MSARPVPSLVQLGSTCNFGYVIVHYGQWIDWGRARILPISGAPQKAVCCRDPQQAAQRVCPEEEAGHSQSGEEIAAD